MTKECPGHTDPDCRKKLSEKVDKKFDESKKMFIKKPAPWVCIILFTAFIIPLGITSHRVWFGHEITPYVYAKKEKVEENTSDIKVLKEQIKRIDENTKETREQVKTVDVKVDKGFKELKELIKELGK